MKETLDNINTTLNRGLMQAPNSRPPFLRALLACAGPSNLPARYSHAHMLILVPICYLYLYSDPCTHLLLFQMPFPFLATSLYKWDENVHLLFFPLVHPSRLSPVPHLLTHVNTLAPLLPLGYCQHPLAPLLSLGFCEHTVSPFLSLGRPVQMTPWRRHDSLLLLTSHWQLTWPAAWA